LVASNLSSKTGGSLTTMQHIHGKVDFSRTQTHLTSPVVAICVMYRQYFVHKSLLEQSEFFQAKLERWPEENLQLPDHITEHAVLFLLQRLYTGSRILVNDIELAIQVLCLGKLWLFDDLVSEVADELVSEARPDHIEVLTCLAEAFDLPNLTRAVDTMRNTRSSSVNELALMVHQAIEVCGNAQIVCEAAFTASPEASNGLLASFDHCDFFKPMPCSCSFTPGFSWFWDKVKVYGLLDAHLPQISQKLICKLEQPMPSTACASMTTTYFDALYVCDSTHLFRVLRDLFQAASEQLRVRKLTPEKIGCLLRGMPSKIYWNEELDCVLATLITSLPLCKGVEVFRLMSSRINDVGWQTAKALQKVATC